MLNTGGIWEWEEEVIGRYRAGRREKIFRSRNHSEKRMIRYTSMKHFSHEFWTTDPGAHSKNSSKKVQTFCYFFLPFRKPIHLVTHSIDTVYVNVCFGHFLLLISHQTFDFLLLSIPS